MQQLVPATSHVSSPLVRCFFHKATNTCSYIVQCPKTKKAAVIDTVLDYGLHSGKLSTEYADTMVAEVEKEGLRVEWIFDTHVHADHITASAYMKNKWPWAKTAISSRIVEVQKEWAKRLAWNDFLCDGSQWDALVEPESFQVEIGELKMTAMRTPGHTPACTSYVVGDAVFVGDAIFAPDFGTARCDFPGGSAIDLYTSISHSLFSLPDHYRLFFGHDYPPATRAVLFYSDVAAEKQNNKFLTANTSQDAFIAARNTRDQALDTPNLLYPSIQFNINAGRLPIANLPSTASPHSFFVKIPLSIPASLQNII